MERVELERTAYELAKKYDKYSHMTKDGKLYGLDIFLKEEMDVNELEVPIVAFFCHDGRIYMTDSDQNYYPPEYFCVESLRKIVNYISDENNLFNDYPNGFYNYNERKLIVK